MNFRFFTVTVASALILAACAKTEPDIPTFDPMDKVSSHWGWKVEQSIAVSPGKDKPSVHHLQAITSGLHDVDFETPPTAFVPVTPSCKVNKPDISSGKYLVIGGGWTSFPLMKKVAVTGVTTFDNKTASAIARKQAKNMLENGTRKGAFGPGIPNPGSNLAMKDVFVTETSESVFIALASGGLYNFHLVPGAQLSGVVVYTGETGYNKTSQVAVAGVPDGVPVHFISQTHKATKNCWTRIQIRPDQTWRKRNSIQDRADAIRPYWKAFFKRVKKDVGFIKEEDVISVSKAAHFLIGPAPTRYEDRIPYTALGGKTIHYSEADHINFGTQEQNSDFAIAVVDQFYEAHLEAMRK